MYDSIMRSGDDPLVVALTDLIQRGDVEGLGKLLAEEPSLAEERFGSNVESRAALHIATDWPGHFPRVAETIATLVTAGAAINARFIGPHQETPLHWAASSNDVAAVEALLHAGADIEASGAVLTNGTPLSDAVVFAQWDAARVLVARGASMTLWQAAALGETTELETMLRMRWHSDQDITNACWHACRVGQLATAKVLRSKGADTEWLGYDNLTSRQVGMASKSAELIAWLESGPEPLPGK
jgi:uncharacterized protein